MIKQTLILFLLFASESHALSKDPGCLKELGLGAEFAQDDLYRPMRMPGGPYKGECLDNRQRRSSPGFSIKHKADREYLKKFGITMKANHSYFGNFKHRNKYYVAEYPNNSIETSILVFEKFMELGGRAPEDADEERAMTHIVLSGHIQLRFKLKKGKYITLYPQTRFARKTKVNDFAFAMFAVRPQSNSGKKFDALGDGIKNGYVMSYNFMSTYDTALSYKKYIDGETQVGQFLMENSHFDSEKALQKLLQVSEDDFFKEKPAYYHTWRNNCVTATFTGIDAGAKNISLPARLQGIVRGLARPMKTIGTRGREWNPLFVLANLERRGIIRHRSESELMTLNRETCLILDNEDLRDVSQLCTRR